MDLCREDAAAGGVAEPPHLTFALLVLGDLVFGVQSEHLVKAVMRPPAMTVLPRSQGALEGVFNDRGQMVPVVDLRRWLSPGQTSSSACPQVAVLQAGGRVLGLAISSVRGLLRARPGDVHPIHHGDQADDFFHSVLSAEGQASPVSLLDPERLMTMAQAWSRESSADLNWQTSEALTQEFAAAMTLPYALVRVGEVCLGFCAGAVGEVLPMPALQKLFGPEAELLGLGRWREHDVPVVNIMPALGLAGPELATAPWVLVLHSQGRMLGVPVDGMEAVQSFRQQEVQLHESTGSGGTPLISGSVMRPEVQQRVFLLDAEALIHRWPESALSLIVADSHSSAGQSDEAGPDLSHGAYVVFTAGLAWTAPMSLMLEILPFPSVFQASVGSDPALLGSLEWRGQSLPMLDARLLTQQAQQEPGPRLKVLVLEVRGQRVAVVVDEVNELLQAQLCVHTRWAMGSGKRRHILTVGQGSAQKSYRVMDFESLAFFSPQA